MMCVSIYSTCDTVASITVLWISGAWGGFFGFFSEMLHISEKQSFSVWNQAFKTGDKIAGDYLTA